MVSVPTPGTRMAAGIENSCDCESNAAIREALPCIKQRIDYTHRVDDEMDKERHNPIREFNSVVLDPTDGDFSITVNGNEEHWWIQDKAIIIIADFIEQKLKKNATP